MTFDREMTPCLPLSLHFRHKPSNCLCASQYICSLCQDMSYVQCGSAVARWPTVRLLGVSSLNLGRASRAALFFDPRKDDVARQYRAGLDVRLRSQQVVS